MVLTLIKGIIAGLGASIPLGPLGVLCIQKTLSKGRNSGFFTGLGSSISDSFYAMLSLFCLAIVQEFTSTHGAIVDVIGGLIIAFVGYRVYRNNPVKQITQKNGAKRHLEDLLEGFAMTITNPGSVFLILMIFSMVGVDTMDSAGSISVLTTLVGFTIGSVAWWYILSTTINVFRKKFRIKQLITMNKVSGVIIIFLGLAMVLRGVLKFLGKYPIS